VERILIVEMEITAGTYSISVSLDRVSIPLKRRVRSRKGVPKRRWIGRTNVVLVPWPGKCLP